MRILGLASACVLVGALCTAAIAETTPGGGGAPGASGSAGPGGRAEGQPLQLPRCAVPLNTIALVESQNPGLAQYGLTSPVPVLRLMIQQSNCFTVADRGQAFTRLQEEQALSGGPKPKIVKAKYFLTPNILFQNQDSGAAGGGLGGLLPGVAGVIGGALRVQKSEAQVTITVTDTDTALQVYAAEGSARTEDVGFAFGGGGGGIGGIGGAYENTDIGKTVTVALLDSYIKVVAYVQQQQGAVRQGTPVP